MNRVAIKVWFTAALFIFGWYCTAWVRAGYTFEVQPLGQGIETMSMDLNGYHGTDVPIADRVREILNADATVNRDYRRPDGSSMMVHMSAWTRPESCASVAPHSPKICYTNGGWKILEERMVDADSPKGKIPLCVLLLEKDTDRCVIAFWYQMGRSTFNTAGEARLIHRKLWGQKRWPATIKVLLQTPGREIEEALPLLKEFATTLFQWTLEL